MRKIKFRAWDKVHKDMCKVKAIFFDIEVVRLYAEKGGEYELKLQDVILMQYTDLKDKNGIEIYEGDIVAFEDSDGGYEYPDLVVNTGIVEYGKLGFYFTNRVAAEMDDFYIKDGRCDDIEVIGNIYENPELMKDGSGDEKN